MTFPDEEKSLPYEQEPSGEPARAGRPQSAPVEPPGETNPAEDQVPPFPVSEPEPEFDFPRMEEDVAAFRLQLQEIDFKPAGLHVLADEPARPTGQRRRRRSNRIVQRPDASELGDRLESIAHRSSPTVDFFIFAFLCGVILAVGYILDFSAILLMGILVAPLMSPWVGAAMSIATGELRFFGQTIGGFFTAVIMVFVVGLLGGLASRIFQPLTFSQAFLHARLWWPDLLMLIIGTTILVVSFIQSEDRPILASLMVAYEFFLPASAAGFGLGSGVDGLWPQAGLVFFIHLALSLTISLLVFFYMGFRPLEVSGYALTGGAVIISLAIVAGFFGLSSLINLRGDQPELVPITTRTTTPTPSAVPVLLPATSTPTVTHVPPTLTRTPAITLTVGLSPSPTLLPTPIYGRIESTGDGAVIRTEPGGTAITTVQNGYLVEFLPADPVVLEGATWVKVLIRTPSRDIEGWVLLNLIITATPSGSP